MTFSSAWRGGSTVRRLKPAPWCASCITRLGVGTRFCPLSGVLCETEIGLLKRFHLINTGSVMEVAPAALTVGCVTDSTSAEVVPPTGTSPI